MKWIVATVALFLTSLTLAQQSNLGPDFQSGYVWAKANSIDDPAACGGKSASFLQGCITYANLRHRSETIATVQNAKPIVLTHLRQICTSNSHKCQAICNAGNQLESASNDLATCAGNHDYGDSCDSQFNDVRDAHDELESAISDAEGDCE
jgi:hypothetical protein